MSRDEKGVVPGASRIREERKSIQDTEGGGGKVLHEEKVVLVG